MRYGVQWLLPAATAHWQRVAAPALPLPAVNASD
jgi:hypothetical protein